MLQPRPKLSGAIILCVVAPVFAGKAHAAVQALATDELWLHRITCEQPYRLTQDCSIWHGAVREIAFGGYHMNLAAGPDGRTLLLAGIRHAPDHNGSAFRKRGKDRGELALKVIDRIDAALAGHGIRLERLDPVRHGRRVAAYFLEFSDDAYAVLKQYTVLASHHWLPRQAARD